MEKSECDAATFTPESKPRHALLHPAIVVPVAVVAVGLAFWGAAELYERQVALPAAKAEYEQAKRDWLAAGLPDAADYHRPRPELPDAENRFKQPPFDGLGAIVTGGPAGALNPSTKWGSVEGGWLGASPLNGFGWDPAEMYKVKARAPFLKNPATGQSPSGAIVEALEAEYPSLKATVACAAAYPAAAINHPDRARPVYEWGGPSFRDVRGNTVVLTAYAGAQLAQKNAAPAVAIIETLATHQAALVGEDALLVSHMIGQVCINISLPRLMWSGLDRGAFSDEELRRVDAALARLDFRRAFVRTLAMEYGFADGVVTAVLADASKKSERVQLGLSTDSQGYRALALHCENVKKLAGLLKPDAAVDLPAVVKWQDAIVTDFSSEGRFCAMGAPSFAKAVTRGWVSQSRVDASRLGVALERYRRATGAYPEKLEALVPAYLAQLPTHPIRGESIRYSVTPAGYELRWPNADYSESELGSVSVIFKHPGPWEIFGEEIKLPESVTQFDSYTIVPGAKPTPKDIVWAMSAPKKETPDAKP